MREQALAWGIRLTAEQVSSLRLYAELLAGHRQANVIGTRDPEMILLEHVTDAMSCFLTGYLNDQQSLIDVGSGGGLPGIPLKLARRDLRLTMLEATAKKVRFLDGALERLRLDGASTINERAEVVGRKAEYREAFDVAVTRAVAALPVIVEYCAPLVNPGGHIVAMKGKLGKEEIEAGERAAAALGARMDAVLPVEFRPEMVQKVRQLVIYRKTGHTPERFPRRVGLAKQSPLGVGGKL